MTKTSSILLIVESPSKCGIIEKYLASENIKCIASFGHFREIKSLKDINIDIENKANFKINYTPIAVKVKQIGILRKEIKKATEVILATDNDREGESIAWHICDLFNLSTSTTKRIIFNEITEKSIQTAYANPKTLNMNVVNAQKARQIIDFVVGFKISPLLWKLASKSLSAGRCQTPALRLINDNEEQIISGANKSRMVYNVTGYFTQYNIPFILNNTFDTFDGELETFFNKVNEPHEYMFSSKNINMSAPTPFSTSHLQQAASNSLRYSPKETMQLCQKLYEKGLITYMRTESTTYSDVFIQSAHNHIKTRFNEKYINSKLTSQKEVEEEEETAHEAIRVTDIAKQNIIKYHPNLEKKEETMYNLIWTNTIQSCMSDAICDSLSVNLTTYNNLKFNYKCKSFLFHGWTKVKSIKNTNIEDRVDTDWEECEEDKYFSYFKNLKLGSILNLKRIATKVTVCNHILHYTEAKLVSLLEKKGIGRPSTFSSLVDKIQNRNYVQKTNIVGNVIKCINYELDLKEKSRKIDEIETEFKNGFEKNKLQITSLGQMVNDYLYDHFEPLFNYGYTNSMEQLLDKVANKTKCWMELCNECNDTVETLVNEVNLSRFEYKFDEHHIFMFAKYGAVVKCLSDNDLDKNNPTMTFKRVKKDIDMNKLKRGAYSLEDVLESPINDNNGCKKEYDLGIYDGQQVIAKKGKFGMYFTYANKNISLNALGNRPIENITLDEIISILQEKNQCVIRDININIQIRKGNKKPDYIYYKTNKMKKPQFLSLTGFQFDYKNCELEVLKDWIVHKHGIV